MSIFCNIYLVDKINNWYCRKFLEKFQFTTHYWSMISSLLHLDGLRPRVYYTLTNFRGGGGKAPLAPPQYANGSIGRGDKSYTYSMINTKYFHYHMLFFFWGGGVTKYNFALRAPVLSPVTFSTPLPPPPSYISSEMSSNESVLE